MLRIMNLIILSLFVYARVVSLVTVPRCERITTPICQNLGYNTTLMPNLMGHEDQRDAALGLQIFGSILRHNCSSFLRLFVCSVFIPLCSEDVPIAVPACRGLCEEVKNDCLSALTLAGFSWPAELNCSRFPEPPNLCMQQPSEEDYKYTPVDHQLQHLRTMPQVCPPDSLPGPNQECLKKCYIEDNKTLFYSIWTVFLSIVCLLITTFVILTFLIQPKRFRWPARPILYLCICGFIRAVLFVVRWIIGPLICSGLTVLERSTDSLVCTTFALLFVYIDVATTIWWLIFCFVWYLSAAKEWSTEGIERITIRLHTVAWTTSTVPLIFFLISRKIELNELTGFCQISSCILVILQLFFVILGVSLAGFTSLALQNVRESLMCEGRCPFKLERLIFRLRIISVGICASLLCSLLCNFFEDYYALLLKVFFQFLSTIFASFWVFSMKTFKSWNKILWPSIRNKRMSSTKV